MAKQQSLAGDSTQLADLAASLEAAQRLFGSPKAFTRLALENPSDALRCAQAAKTLTGSLRQIQALA